MEKPIDIPHPVVNLGEIALPVPLQQGGDFRVAAQHLIGAPHVLQVNRPIPEGNALSVAAKLSVDGHIAVEPRPPEHPRGLQVLEGPACAEENFDPPFTQGGQVGLQPVGQKFLGKGHQRPVYIEKYRFDHRFFLAPVL